MIIRITSLAIAAATLAAATIPASASAAPATAGSGGYENVAVEVRTDDLNLATASGRSALDRRINYAARKACGFSRDKIDLVESQRQNACMSKARGNAETAVAARIAQTSALAAK